MLNKKKISILFGILMILSMMFTTLAFAIKPIPLLGPTLNPRSIPKYTEQLPLPPVYTPSSTAGGVDAYTIRMVSGVNQQILPASLFPTTPTWAYQGTSAGEIAWSPSYTFEATRGTPVQVTWVNDITENYMFAVDPTLHWADPTYTPTATQPMRPLVQPYPTYPGLFTYSTGLGTTSTFNPQTPIPLVPHLHGGETPSVSDGGPEQWFTNGGIHGPDYASVVPGLTNAATYYYPNEQEPATLWYHDHALGLTRINVMSGLAGFYLLRDPTFGGFDEYMTTNFVYGTNEIPLAIQDRSFNTDGKFWFDSVGVNPTDHPYWVPEFFGNTIMVNGKVWPNLNVDQGWYRFRLLDGSNARFYTIALKDQTTGAKIPFIQIGTDGGYLQAPVTLNSLTIAPGERADILVDFSAIPAGTKIIVENKAKAPFPNGVQPDPKTTGQIMQFTVTATAGFNQGQQIPFPAPLNPTLTGATFPTLTAPAAFVSPAVNPRTLPLVEVMGALGPLEAMLNGQKWMAPTTETPQVGDTEDWIIPNLTGDTHPIHLHLVQFQLVSRQKFDAAQYNADWLAQNAAASGVMMPPWPNDFVPIPLDVTPYLKGKPAPAALNEQGWKDTVQMNPGEVTIIRVRFMTQNGSPFPFDATAGPGYVWHCHIIDHEDNEMMRRMEIVP